MVKHMALSPSPQPEDSRPFTLHPTPVNASLLTISEAVGSSLDLKEVLYTILSVTLEEVHGQQGSILLFDEHQDRLEMLAAIGIPREIIEKGYIPRKGSVAEYVIEHNKPLIMNDNDDESEGTLTYKRMDKVRLITSSMCVPLRANGKVLGTINLNRTDESFGQFQSSDLDMMSILASQAAIFIENSRLHETNLKSERFAAIGQTVAGVSHCVKNVLTGVKGGMSLIEMASGVKDWELLLKGQDILQRNLDRLGTLVLDMLDYSKERKAVKSPIQFKTLADEVIRSVECEARDNSVIMEMELDENAETVRADGQQLYRCLLNLVHNSLDVTPEGGKVLIRSEVSTSEGSLNRLRHPERSEAAYVIRVGDGGPGIEEEQRRVIFEPFFSTKGSRGTGLGLAVTRKIIEEHGGHIEVETTSPDPAVFAIYLPA
jgi:signal transduction histidine kinase